MERNEQYFSIAGIGWQIEVLNEYFNKKAKALLVELVGDLPQPGQGYRYGRSEEECIQGLLGGYLFKNLSDWNGTNGEYIPTRILVEGSNGYRRIMQNTNTGKKKLLSVTYLSMIDNSVIEKNEGEIPCGNPIIQNSYFVWKNNVMSYACMITNVKYVPEHNLLASITDDDMVWNFSEEYLIKRD